MGKLPTQIRSIIGLSLSVFLFGFIATNHSNSPEAIVKRSLDRLNAGTTYSEMSIRIVRPKWTRTVDLATWTKGSDQALAVVLKPEKERGMIFLKKGDEVWNYRPKIKSTVKLPSSMMGQNWMGSDLSNGDLLKQISNPEEFTMTHLGSSQVSGVSCHQIQLIPKPGTPVVWGKIVLHISKADYIQMKSEFYDEDEDLINTLLGSQVKVLGGIKVASVYTMIPEGKSGHKTIITTRKLKLNPSLSRDFFSIDSAKRLDL
jgi:outer membrane lipoprotein-sorting protein